MLVRFDYPKRFDQVVGDFFAAGNTPECVAYPAIDITEQEHETVVLAELPGVKKEDINVKFENNVLTISGERKQNEIPENARVILNERRVQNFSRSIKFDNTIDAAAINAELNNGVLRVALQKTEDMKAREIHIQ